MQLRFTCKNCNQVNVFPVAQAGQRVVCATPGCGMAYMLPAAAAPPPAPRSSAPPALAKATVPRTAVPGTPMYFPPATFPKPPAGMPWGFWPRFLIIGGGVLTTIVVVVVVVVMVSNALHTPPSNPPVSIAPDPGTPVPPGPAPIAVTPPKTEAALPGTLRTLAGTTSPRRIDYICVSPDGQRVVTTNAFGGVHLWDLTTGKLQVLDAERNFAGPPRPSARFSSDGQRVAWIAGNSFKVWNVADKRMHATGIYPGAWGDVRFIPGTRQVWADCPTVITKLLRYDGESGKYEESLLDCPAKGDMVFAADGTKALLWLPEFRIGDQGTDRALYMYDLKSAAKQYTALQKLADVGSPIAFTPDSKSFLIREDQMNGDTKLRLLTWPAGTAVRNLLFKGFYQAGPFSPDGTRLVVSLYRGAPTLNTFDHHLVEVDTGKIAMTLPTPGTFKDATSYVVDFLPDGRRLVLGCADGKVRVLE